jgi:triosephosphate isomerase
MVCVGESDAQREAGETFNVLKTQLDSAFKAITDWSKIVIAYEPIWAIGTGKTATPEIAQEVCAFIRNHVKENVSEAVANALRI